MRMTETEKTKTEKTKNDKTKNDKQLLPVYLFVGADALKRESLLKRLMKRVEAQSDITLNSQVFEASSVREPNEVIDACNTMPFAASLRLVTVKNVDKASKQLIDALVAYIKNPSETTVLVVEAEKLAKNSRLISAAQKLDPKTYVDCSEKTRGELPSLVRSMAASRGANMNLDAAGKLIELVGTSTIALDSAVEKTVSFVTALGRTNINRNDVDAVVARSALRNPWDFVDAFAGRQRCKAFELLNELVDESPVNLLVLCVMRIRELITVKALQGRGYSSERAIAEALSRPDWQVRRLIQASQAYSAFELRALLAKAAQTDMKMKSGADPALLLSMFILEA